MNLYEVAHVVGGKLLAGRGDAVATGLVVDSQKVQPGDIFVAFVGQTTNGHRFVPDAVQRGAVAVFVTEDVIVPDSSQVAVVKVQHPLAAIHRLARHERDRFSGPVIGVTGSNGKTTTKEMLARVFSSVGDCLYTEGNMNTELGLPLTLLKRSDSHCSIVLEMGMRGLGQIAELCDVARPNAGIITNIGQSHMELLGSQENIARAKSELLQAIPKTGYAALPASDPWLRQFSDTMKGRVLWYNIADEEGRCLQGEMASEQLFASATNLQSTPEGVSFTARVNDTTSDVRLSTHGRHNVLNALGAFTLGAVHGLSLPLMAVALADLKGTTGRLNVLSGKRGITVIDDCYNASPLSMKASLDVLRDLAHNKRSVAVLGDMYELGALAEAGHREVGAYASESGVDIVLAIGPMARWIADEARQGGVEVHHAESREQAEILLPRIAPSGSVVLVKASRGMGLEQVVQAMV